MLNIIRTNLENNICKFANVAGIIFLNPIVKTEKGNVEMIGRNGSLMEDINGDWVIHGTIHNLTDEDFMKVYEAALEKAREILRMSE